MKKIVSFILLFFLLNYCHINKHSIINHNCHVFSALDDTCEEKLSVFSSRIFEDTLSRFMAKIDSTHHCLGTLVFTITLLKFDGDSGFMITADTCISPSLIIRNGIISAIPVGAKFDFDKIIAVNYHGNSSILKVLDGHFYSKLDTALYSKYNIFPTEDRLPPSFRSYRIIDSDSLSLVFIYKSTRERGHPH